MLSYFLNCRKNPDIKNPKVARKKMEEYRFYQNVKRVIVKIQNLSKIKKLLDY